jgi:DnaJ-class molecular chaperone
MMTEKEALSLLELAEASQPTTQELKKAYKRVALKVHPDRPQNDGNKERATRQFQDVCQAFELMKKRIDA